LVLFVSRSELKITNLTSVDFAPEPGHSPIGVGTPVLRRHSATNPEQLHFALTVEAMEFLKAKGAAGEPVNVPTFKLGSRFFESASSYNATGMSGAHCDLLREACGRIIVDDPKYPIGTLDKPDSFGKMSPITRQRDSAVACRTHLQKSHEALRLMFWRLKDGTIEFANIGPKNELVIADGSTETVEKNECWDS
jgi:hypothetical protein